MSRLASFLALNRTVAIVLLSILLFGLGEQMWETFMPAFLVRKARDLRTDAETRKPEPGTRNAPGLVPLAGLLLVAAYAASRNLFEGFCYIGGGRLTARLGDRGSFLIFALLTIAGYLVVFVSSAPWAAAAGALLILGFEPLSVPATFTTVGATVEARRQGMAFAVQSIQKRLPKIIGPLIAAAVITRFAAASGDPEAGRAAAFPWLMAGALALALLALLAQWRFLPHREPPAAPRSLREVFACFPPELRRLLAADILVRWCDWLVREFVILYVLLVLRETDMAFGRLTALQHGVALLTYLPIGRWTQAAGLEPFIGLTFVFFALFPATLAASGPGAWLALPFAVYGLREIGEPARKAFITKSLPEEIRAQGVGLYWGLRAFLIAWAPLVGALVFWRFGPRTLLAAASVCGAAGAVLYYAWVRPGGGRIRPGTDGRGGPAPPGSPA